MHFLEFKELKKKYGKKEVLSDVSFDLREGEIFGSIEDESIKYSILACAFVIDLRVFEKKS